jgi:hypothetical protein
MTKGNCGDRWLVLVAGLFVNLYCGVTYAFGLYSNVLRDTFGYSQSELTLVAAIGNIAGFFAVPSGMVYDKYGPRTTILVGVLMAFTGYFLLWVAVKQYFDASLATVCVFAAIANNCQTWFDTASVVTNMNNFPNNRGTVAGLLKSMNGLGASVFSQIYTGIFDEPDTVSFMLTLPFLAAIPLASAFIVRKVPPKHCQAAVAIERFYYAYALTATIATFLLVSSLIGSSTSLSSATNVFFTVVMVLLLLAYGLLPYRADQDGGAALNQALLEGGAEGKGTFSPGHVTYSRASSKFKKQNSPNSISTDISTSFLSTSALFASDQTGAADGTVGGTGGGTGAIRTGSTAVSMPVMEGESADDVPYEAGSLSRPLSSASEYEPNPSDISVASTVNIGAWEEPRSYSLQECLHRPDFYLLFVVVAVGTGAGLTVINNITQISQSIKVLYNNITALTALS